MLCPDEKIKKTVIGTQAVCQYSFRLTETTLNESPGKGSARELCPAGIICPAVLSDHENLQFLIF